MHSQKDSPNNNASDAIYSMGTHTHPFNGPFCGTTQVSQYQKGRTNLDITEARDSEWQWHQLGHMQVCTSLQTDNHASTPLLSFLQARCPSCRPTNSAKALKEKSIAWAEVLKHKSALHTTREKVSDMEKGSQADSKSEDKIERQRQIPLVVG